MCRDEPIFKGAVLIAALLTVLYICSHARSRRQKRTGRQGGGAGCSHTRLTTNEGRGGGFDLELSRSFSAKFPSFDQVASKIFPF